MARTPGFFIVGAPKCGTTAMHQYLGAHPDVFVPHRKEPHHFGRDIRSPRFVNDRREYLELFDRARDERVVGEASVWYMSSRHAAQEIAAFAPGARILVMLRDPAELVRSLHNHNVANGIEDITDLGVALDAGTERFRGRIVGQPAIAEFLDYIPVGHFAVQLQRFQAYFPADQMHVVIYEEFARDPAAAYDGVLRFLGVDPSFRPSFERVNAARRSKSTTLARWLHAPPPRVQRVMRATIPGVVRRSLWHGSTRRLLTRVNSEPASSLPFAPAVRERLRSEYRDDVLETARLIRRPDLATLWGYDDVRSTGRAAATAAG